MRRHLTTLLVLGILATSAPVTAQDVADPDEFRLDYVATRLSFGGAREVVTQGEQVQVNLAADVLFDVDSSDLSDEALSLLERTADELADAAEGTVEIVGHTDDTGTLEINQPLSEDRADAVRDALLDALGTTDLDFETDGRADTEPAVEGTSDEARQANRRVEVRYQTR
ncbi:MAG: OmpA family protein [Nitriliruptoraceae bacterium]|nr:OmpA family protein [Nitriliruptoraceae bacterium]